MSMVVAWIRPQAVDIGLIGIIGDKSVLSAIILVFFVGFFIFVDFGFFINELIGRGFATFSLWLEGRPVSLVPFEQSLVSAAAARR